MTSVSCICMERYFFLCVLVVLVCIVFLLIVLSLSLPVWLLVLVQCCCFFFHLPIEYWNSIRIVGSMILSVSLSFSNYACWTNKTMKRKTSKTTTAARLSFIWKEAWHDICDDYLTRPLFQFNDWIHIRILCSVNIELNASFLNQSWKINMQKLLENSISSVPTWIQVLYFENINLWHIFKRKKVVGCRSVNLSRALSSSLVYSKKSLIIDSGTIGT